MTYQKIKGMKAITLVCLLGLTIGLYGCSNESKTTAPSQTETTQQATEGIELTLEELKAYNGQNGQPAYVAVDGVIYDVTNTKKWKDGKHQNGVTAGNDLTEMIKKAPHGTSTLKEAVVVGKIVE